MSELTNSPEDFLAIQVIVLQAAVKALCATHPNPKEVESIFRNLIAQIQAQPALFGEPSRSHLIRRFANDLFQPSELS